MTAGHGDRRRAARRAAGRRLLPRPGRPVRHDAARRPGRRGRQGRGPRRRRHPHLDAARPRRRLHLLPGRQPQQAVDRAGPARRRPTLALARELARRADVLIENFKPGGLAKFGLDYDAVARRQPAARLRLDQRLRHRRRGRDAARLRPDGAGDVGPDEPHRRRRTGRRTGPGISVFDVMAGQPRGDRHPRRAAATATRPARASTSRSTCCRRRCPGWSTTLARTSRAASCPYRMGNAHPSVFPYEPLPTRRRRPDRHRRQRRPVPQAVRGARHPGGGRRPAVRAATRDRTANRDELRPILVERLRDPRRGGVVRAAHRRRACRAGRSTPSTAGSRSPSSSGSSRSSTVGRGRARACPSARQPDHVLRHARRLPRCRRRSWTSTATSCGAGWPARGGRAIG